MTDHLITRPVTLANCSHCSQLTFTAISGGLTVTVDPEPLTIAQEIAVRLTGKTTFDLVPHGRRLFLEWRDIARVRAGRSYPVVAIHPCTSARQEPVPPVTTGEVPDDPPF